METSKPKNKARVSGISMTVKRSLNIWNEKCAFALVDFIQSLKFQKHILCDFKVVLPNDGLHPMEV
jgi:hypothetical protein